MTQGPSFILVLHVYLFLPYFAHIDVISVYKYENKITIIIANNVENFHARYPYYPVADHETTNYH